jgi:microcystin-dependent protein
MSEPFIGEIKIFAGIFAPRGYAFCDGQTLPIAQNTALFSILGTTFGGDGRTTLGLPDLRGRAPMHTGNGPGLTSRRMGQEGGTEAVTLTEVQLAGHQHVLMASGEEADRRTPASNRSLAESMGGSLYTPAANLVAMDSRSITETGGDQAHNNVQPYLTLNFIIALVGVYPSRN